MAIAPAAPALPPAGRKRKHRPLSVERDACLYALGVDPTLPWEMQHDPPLASRPWDAEAQDYVPAENDPRHMRPMQKQEHKQVTKEVDRPRVDKARRQGEGQAAHREAMIGKAFPSQKAQLREIAKRQKKWPKGRPIQSRGFPQKRGS